MDHKFQTYSQATQLDQGQLVDIIEQNIDSSIIWKIIEEDTCPTDLADYLTKVWNIGQKRQLTRFLGIAGPSRSRDPNAMDISALDAVSDEESEVEIDVFTREKGKARTPARNRKLIACLNCGKPGHMAKECKIPSTQCTECNWSRGGHKPRCSKASKIQTTTEEPTTSWDQRSRAIRGMSFDEAKALFYDMHNVKDKGQAKVL